MKDLAPIPLVLALAGSMISIVADAMSPINATRILGLLALLSSQAFSQEPPRIAALPDGGSTFSPAADLGVDPCECCGSRAIYAQDGSLAVLYRDRSDDLRDTNVATLAAGGAKWSSRVISKTPWPITSCPMTGSFLSRSGAMIAAAWETKGQVYFRVGLGADTKEVRAAEKGRYPIVLSAGDGTKLVAWKDGSQLMWQFFDADNAPTAGRGKHQGKSLDRPAGVVTKSGRTILIP